MAPDVVDVANCHAFSRPNLSIIRRVCITYAVDHAHCHCHCHCIPPPSKCEMESATVSRSIKCGV